MATSRTITLFTESRDLNQRSTSLAVSILFHCLALSLLSFGVMYSPHLDTRAIAERYTVRNIDLATPEQQRRRAEQAKANYPHPLPKLKSNTPGASKPLPPPALRQIAQAQKGPQTLIQPDLPIQVALTEEVPVPSMVIWSPQKTPVKNLVAPLPDKPTAADVKPSPDPPNVQVDLADISISVPAVTVPKLPTPATTTSPVAVQAPDRVQLAPATVSQPNAQPTPAAVMSLSDIRMAQGKVVLPPVNESATTNAPGIVAPGPTQDPSAAGAGKDAGSAGAGKGASSPTDAASQIAAATKPNGSEAPPRPGTETGTAQDNQPTATRITLPKNGQFGAIVIGDSLQDEFPELATVWNGRLAYTVYLHVGTARSWILQYSLPRSDDLAMTGNVDHLEAPWPYNIVRPNLGADPGDANTIMVHGFVNQAGHFESLNIVFPPQCPDAQFVLKSLQNWQFRPATQNGQIARVEVLLIIPEEMN